MSLPYGYVCLRCDHPSSGHLSKPPDVMYRCEICDCDGNAAQYELTRSQWCAKFGHLEPAKGRWRNCQRCRVRLVGIDE